jgi:hypothetical protein
MTPLSPRTHIKVTVSRRESTIVFATPFACRVPGRRRGPVKSYSKEMSSSDHIAHVEHERRLQRLIRRLPGKIQAITRWLRRPASRWARIPAGALLIVGGCLSILPFFGLWMLPLGLILLADDIAPLRRARGWALDWMARRRPHWFAGPAGRGGETGSKESGCSPGPPPRVGD